MWMLAEVTVSTGFMVLAILAIVAQSILLLVSLFGSGYRVTEWRSRMHRT